MSLPAEYDDLSRLARGIRDHHEAARKLAGKSRDTLAQAVAEVALAGDKLRKVKAILPHGDFLPWLKKHCKAVSERTAQRYMRISNTSHVADLQSADSIRQAYLLCGIIKDPAPAGESLAIFRLPSLSRITTIKPFDSWLENERDLFKTWFDEQVAPLVAIRQRLK